MSSNGHMQLTMRLDATRLRAVPPASVPDPYQLAGADQVDPQRWAQLLRVCGFRDWTAAKVRDFLAAPVRTAGSRVVVLGDRAVAASFASAAIPGRSGMLDYVVAHPQHRRRGLGRMACAAVLGHFAAAGYQEVSLLTDDHRLAAIAVYLALGFAPVLNRSDMERRWREVRRQLDNAAERRPAVAGAPASGRSR